MSEPETRGSGARRVLEVGETEAGKRLDVLVCEKLELSRARVKRLFDERTIRVDGRPGKKGQLVAAGQRVEVTLEEQPLAAVPDASTQLVVLHADEALVFVDKPAKVPSHPLQPGETGTVANALVQRFPECRTASREAREGGLCHRLDRDTSGVLLAARTPEAWLRVREAFERRAVDKRYLALVTGPIADKGEIDLPLRHHPRHPDRVEPAPLEDREAREALSSFRVLDRAGEYTLVEVRIVTGVLHQVRAHLGAIGAPLVGDALYGGRPEPGLDRFFLHARSLELDHPATGARARVESPLPEELGRVLAAHGLCFPPAGSKAR